MQNYVSKIRNQTVSTTRDCRRYHGFLKKCKQLTNLKNNARPLN
jgi:hypothetical protein